MIFGHYIKFLKFINKKINENIIKCEKSLSHEIIVMIKHDTINDTIDVNLYEDNKSAIHLLKKDCKVPVTMEWETIDYGDKVEYEFEGCRYVIHKQKVLKFGTRDNE